MRIVTTVLLVLVLFAGTASAGEEPEFDGKPASWWAVELSQGRYDLRDARRAKAWVALSRGGAEALPVLVTLLAGDLESEFAATEILSALAIHDSDLGPDLIDALVPLALDNRKCDRATVMLRLLSVAHPGLAEDLRTRLIAAMRSAPENGVFLMAPRLLASVSDGSKKCIRSILRLLTDRHLTMGFESYLGRYDATVIEVSLELLGDASRKEASSIAKALDTNLGIPFEVVIDLHEVLRIPGRTLVGHAREWLLQWCRLERTGFAHRRRAFLILRSDPSAQMAVLNTMKEDAVEAPGFAEFAAEALADDKLAAHVRFTLIRISGSLPPASRASLLPQLMAGLAHEDAALRQMAAEVIGTLGPAAKEAVPALAKGLLDEGQWVPETCAIALGNIGPAAKAALPDLEKAAGSDDERLAAAAKDALVKIRRE